MNRSEEALAFALKLGAQQVRAELPPRAIATFLAEH
jgi:O-glycosyl hydrolase